MLSTEMSRPTTGSALLQSPPASSPNQNILPLTAAVNGQGHLEIGGCSVPELVEKFGSPLYILDESTLRQAAQQYRDGFQSHYPGESQVIYASKAWSCLAVVAIAAQEGIGFDVVSGGELFTTVEALKSLGWNPDQIAEKIYFHGNNKSIQELQEAISIDCTIIVDNWL